MTLDLNNQKINIVLPITDEDQLKDPDPECQGPTLNLTKGCAYGCKYCFSEHFFGKKYNKCTHDQWLVMNNRKKPSLNTKKLYDMRVMVALTHDIFPSNLDLYKQHCKALLDAGNTIRIVTKGNSSCILKLQEHLQEYKYSDAITWRFTITTLDDTVRKYWEPSAPSISKRLEILEKMYDLEWTTSVSIEPFLDDTIIDLVKKVLPFITEKIYIAPMNRRHMPRKYWTNIQDHLYSPVHLLKIKLHLEQIERDRIVYRYLYHKKCQNWKTNQYKLKDDWFHEKDIWETIVKQNFHGGSILEIGSWEGRSALWILDNLNPEQLYCVDIFNTKKGSQFIQSLENAEKYEQTFDRNIDLHPIGNRVIKIKSTSYNFLKTNLRDGSFLNKKFNMIYIDGSHSTYDVFSDLILSWEFLNNKGILICDDYNQSGPAKAMNKFMKYIRDEGEVLHKAIILVIQKQV